MIAVLGIDPGIEAGKSHGVVLGLPADLFPPHAPRYDVLDTWELSTPEDAPLGLFPYSRPVTSVPYLIVFAAVESARGQVIKGRSGDPVLRNATMSGRLQEHARTHLAAPVGTVPALGAEQGWNWRGALGCAGMTDDGVRLTVERRLTSPLPLGKRGGKNSHWVDAAGIAVAALDRLLAGGATLPTDPVELLNRWHARSTLETAVQAVVSDRRAARRQGRKLQKKVSL